MAWLLHTAFTQKIFLSYNKPQTNLLIGMYKNIKHTNYSLHNHIHSTFILILNVIGLGRLTEVMSKTVPYPILNYNLLRVSGLWMWFSLHEEIATYCSSQCTIIYIYNLHLIILNFFNIHCLNRNEGV